MLDQLLPPSARTAVAFADDPDEACYPGEESLVATAAPGRRREILTARRCAREALLALGHAPSAILRGASREPLWPSGVAGSLTHCAGFRAAAVAHAADIPSLGIDAEPHAPLPPRVLGSVTTPSDRDLLARLAITHPETCWDRLLFSAKESIYKTWFPLTGTWLGFEDAALTIDPDERTFTGHILIPPPTVTLPIPLAHPETPESPTSPASAASPGFPASAASPASLAASAASGSSSDGAPPSAASRPTTLRLTELHGRFLIDRGLIVTAVHL